MLKELIPYSKPVRWVLYWAAWTIIAFFFVVQGYAMSRLLEYSFRLGPQLAVHLSTYLTWGLLAPLIFQLLQRIRHLPPLRQLVLVAIAGIGFSFLHRLTVLSATSLYMGLTLPELGFTSYLNTVGLLTGFFGSFAAYSVVAVALYAIRFFIESRRMEARAQSLQTELAQAQLQALRSQLRPHFLFNALNTVSALMSEDQDKAQKTIFRIGELLRLTLKEPEKETVPLREEMELVYLYLEIEKSRYEDRLQVQFDIDRDALSSPVPLFLLQPLIENAVRHGVAERPNGGTIEVSAKRRNSTLFLEVKDDGPGLRGDSSTLLTRGVGLRSIQDRLQQVYGARARFGISNLEKTGLRVSLEIPEVGE